MACVEIENVSLSYPVYGHDARLIKRLLFSAVVGSKITKNNSVAVVEALKNISFVLNPGDRVGIIGSNGAGKSTLLKVLAGIYPPSSGSVCVEGRTNCLFDIMMGMDHELNGYENIALRGLILGLSKTEIKTIVPRVEEFAELGDFFKMPIKSYSSGMKLRLAFGIITNVCSEVLLIDEIVSVGDAKFVAKAEAQIKSLVHRTEYVVLASHDKHLIQQLCNKFLWLENGQIKSFGSLNDVKDYF